MLSVGLRGKGTAWGRSHLFTQKGPLQHITRGRLAEAGARGGCLGGALLPVGEVLGEFKEGQAPRLAGSASGGKGGD